MNSKFLINNSSSADSTKISFESCSQPGYYVRHYKYVLRLDALSALHTTIAKNEATFKRTNYS
ncbi:AbfB domain-containing protein [Paenibacillus algorifonticola]|uniref:AbfB domain-containing protein n=1 Tax=Paenibacillus algorifonticola TaxID=684063 RepID=UPI000943CA3D